jgi:hypothetical protein
MMEQLVIARRIATMALATVAALGAVACSDAEDDDGGTASNGTPGAGTGGQGTGGTGATGATGGGGAGTGGGTMLDIAVCAPTAGPFSLTIDNDFFPLPVGQIWSYQGMEDGEQLTLEIEVLDETEMVAGVETRVVREDEKANGEQVEISWNFFVQAADGTVCYYGEDVDIYERGAVVAHDGAWRAGEGGALPGIQMPATPAVGQQYDQELAPGIAEDHAEVIALGEHVEVPAGAFDDTLRTEESTPLEPGQVSEKLYARGVGLLVDGAVELTAH